MAQLLAVTIAAKAKAAAAEAEPHHTAAAARAGQTMLVPGRLDNAKCAERLDHAKWAWHPGVAQLVAIAIAAEAEEAAAEANPHHAAGVAAAGAKVVAVWAPAFLGAVAAARQDRIQWSHHLWSHHSHHHRCHRLISLRNLGLYYPTAEQQR